MEDNNLNADHDTHTVEYWKQRALHMEKLLEASLQREQVLVENLAELSQNSNMGNNFLHSILQNSPVIIGHQDKDLGYRYIYNHLPGLKYEVKNSTLKNHFLKFASVFAFSDSL